MTILACPPLGIGSALLSRLCCRPLSSFNPPLDTHVSLTRPPTLPLSPSHSLLGTARGEPLLQKLLVQIAANEDDFAVSLRVFRPRRCWEQLEERVHPLLGVPATD